MKTESNVANVRVAVWTTMALVALATFAAPSVYAAQPNITFTTPAGWTDKMVLSNGTGTNIDTPISTSDTVYLDFAFTNSGTADISTPFQIKVFINGVQFSSISQATLTQGQIVKVEDIKLGTLSLGSPVIRIELDSPTASNGVIAESNEADNVYSRNINVTAPTPVINSILVDTATEGVPYYYRITASNNPTSFTTSSLLNAALLPSGLSLNPSTGEITGTPTPTSVGSLNILISASNVNGTGSAVLALTILARAPHITSPGSATATIGRFFSYTITALGTPPITYTASTLPADLGFIEPQIGGVPKQGGNVKVNLIATNAAGSQTVPLDLTIQSPPVITSTLIKAANIGVPFSYSITATLNPVAFAASVIEANGVVLATPVQLSAIPDPTYGFAINNSTGILSGTPLLGGQFVVRIRAGGTTLIRNLTGNVTTAGTAVAFSGIGNTTRFLTELVVGDKIVVGGQIRFISAITNNQNLTVNSAFSPNVTNAAPLSSLYGTARLVVGVSNAINTPAITSPLTATATESDAFAYGITATNNPTSFTATVISGPVGPVYPITLGSVADVSTGLQFDNLTGVIFGVPPQTAASPTPYVIRMIGSNVSGTSSNSADLSVTISLALPRITSPLKKLFLDSAPVNYQITGIYTDPNIYGPITFAALNNTLPGFLVLDTNTGVISSPNFIMVGVFVIDLQITNNRGPGPISQVAITINNANGPVFTNPDSKVAVPGYPFSFSLTTVAPASFAEYNPTVLNNPNLNLTLTSSGLIFGTISLGAVPGNYYPVFQAVNDNLDASAFRLTIQVVTGLPINGPIINSPLLASNTAGLQFNYDISVAGSPVPDVPDYMSTFPLPQGVALLNDTLYVPSNTGFITGIPTQAGTTFVTITSQNPSGSDTTNVAVTINNITITSPLTATGTVGQVFSPYQVKATGVPIRYDASGLPAGLSIDKNTGFITGIPAEVIPTGTSVTYNVLLSASNAYVTGTRTVVFTINAAPLGSPIITNSPLTAFADDGKPFTYQITASGGPITAFGALGLPSGFTLDNDPLSATYGQIAGTSSKLGLYSVILTATNVTGADAKVLNLTVLPVPPVVTSPLDQSVLLGVVGQLSDFTISATGSVPMTYAIQNGPLPAGLTLNANHVKGTPTTAGDYPATINVTNAGGSTTFSVTFRILEAPKLTDPGVLSGVIGANFKYTPVATGTTPITFNFSGNIPPGINVVNGNSLQGVPTSGGSYLVKVVANNVTSLPDTLTVTIIVTDMQITSPLTMGAAIGQAFTYTITATGNPITFAFGSASNFPPGVTLTAPDTISGIPTQAGAFTLPLSVTNAGGGLGNATLQIGVSTAPGAPAIISNLLQTGVVGQNFTYSINATNTPTSYAAVITDGPDGLPYPITLTGVPDTTTGFLISGSTISGNMLKAGTFIIGLTASNALGLGTAKLQAAISAVTGGPAITSRLSDTVLSGVPYTYQITSINAPQGPNNFSVTTAFPPGTWTLNADTGLIFGTASLPALTYKIGLKVTTKIGTASANFYLTIVAGTPTITSPLSVSSPLGQPFPTYTTTATGLAPISFSVDPATLPPGLSATGGVITGTPTQEGSYLVTLTATNSLGAVNATLVIIVGPIKPTLTISSTKVGKVALPFNLPLTAFGSVPITFTVTGALPPGLTQVGAVISGKPTQIGVYPITITATNSLGSDSASVTITILERDEDTDLDGFPDEFEIAFGSDPSDATSTPFGGGKPAGLLQVINIKTMTIKLASGVSGKDSISVQGTFEVPSGFKAPGQKVTFCVGGVLRTYTLDSRGTGTSGGDSLRLTVRKTTATFTGIFSKGTFSDDLSDEGLDLTQTLSKVSRQIRVNLMLSDTLYESKKLLSYTSKANKSGTAINPR